MVLFDKGFKSRALCRVEKKCHLCGVALDKIHHLEPDPTRTLPYDPVIRPPLCLECWTKRIAEVTANGTMACPVDIKRETGVGNVVVLACGLVGLQVMDAVTTVIGTRRGWDEMNPLIAPLADSWFLLLLKIVAAVCAILCVNFLAKITQMIRPVITGMMLGMAFLALVVLNNVVVLTFDKAVLL